MNDLEKENLLLKKLLCLYEKNRQKLVQALGISAQHNPELINIIPANMQEEVSQNEQNIERILGALNFDAKANLHLAVMVEDDFLKSGIFSL